MCVPVKIKNHKVGKEKDIEKQSKYCWKIPRRKKIRGFLDPLLLTANKNIQKVKTSC